MKINNKNSYFELILASVLRNELRNTAKYIELDTFQEIVIDNLDYMSEKMKMIFKLVNAKDYGYECDKRSWMELLDCLKSR